MNDSRPMSAYETALAIVPATNALAADSARCTVDELFAWCATLAAKTSASPVPHALPARLEPAGSTNK